MSKFILKLAVLRNGSQEILKNLNKKVLVEKDYHLMTWKNKDYKIAKSSDLGRFLYNFPNIAKANKKKESFLCRKEK